MKARVEWVVGMIRAGPQFKKHGDPYEFVCTVMKQDKKAFLMAASGVFDKRTYQAIKELCDKLGLEEVTWERKNNKPRKKTKFVT